MTSSVWTVNALSTWPALFTNIQMKNEGEDTFGDKSKGQIISCGKVENISLLFLIMYL